MMKKIFLTENKIINNKKMLCENIDKLKLPPFIFKRVKNKNTSLGDNLAFPPEEEFSFDYKILKRRFNEVTEKIKEVEGINSLNEDELITHLGGLIKECRELERPIRSNLVKICENTVNEMLAIPDQTVNLTCELVDKVEPKNEIRITPESNDRRNFDFEDLNEFDSVGKIIGKRRLINALIQGASYQYAKSYELYLHELYKLNKKLPELYDDINTINDYLLFIKEENISDENPMQGACVEVILGRNGEKSEIYAQGLLFPYLLTETIRGFFELFASHGLPQDTKKAMYIIKQADFLLAEPWDLRMGVELWKYLSTVIDDTRLLPYYFATICELPVDEFNTTIKEVFAETKKGKIELNGIVETIKNEINFNDLTNTIKQKNSEFALMTDGYFSSDELNDYVIEEDDEQQQQQRKLTLDDLKNVRAEDIAFEVADNTNSVTAKLGVRQNQFQIIPVINNIEVPVNLINFQAESRIVFDEEMYQLHLEINDKLQHMGLGFKLYYAFILTYGMAYSNLGRRANNNEIPKIWDKLANMNNITVTDVYNDNKQKIGVKAILN